MRYSGSNKFHNVSPEARKINANITTNSADTETVDFQQEPVTTKPPDQIKEILSMIQLMMREIQQLKQSSINIETKETSKQE